MASKVQTQTFTSNGITSPSVDKIYMANIQYYDNFTLKTVKYWYELGFVKYQIKESDMRRKTASITVPGQLDLTQGVFVVKIISPRHENFTGVFLKKDFTRGTDGNYTYQCQDMSRFYQSKHDWVVAGDVTLYRIVKRLLTRGEYPLVGKITDALKKAHKNTLSGLRPLALYQPSLYGNPIKINMLAQKPKVIIRDVSEMDAILDICHSNADVDIYFDDNAVLQIEPISREDWENTGLVLTRHTIYGTPKFTFDTTNAITGVTIKSTSETTSGTTYYAESLLKLDLTAFFGTVTAMADNPNKATATTSSSSKKTTKKTTNTGNPYGTKRKYLLIDADGGETKSFLDEIAKYIREGGWTVDVDGNIGPGAHSRNKGAVKNGCYMPVYNGLCAGTINEMPASYYGGVIKNNGSVLCPAWDTRDWTSASMSRYRNDITGISYLQRAWDDNFSPSGFSGISNPSKFMTNNGIKYCVGDSAKKIANQFLAGGWVAYNKK